MQLPTLSFLNFSFVLFFLGVFGLFVPRKNMIIVLMAIEIILLSTIFNFVFFSSYLIDLLGNIFALLVLTLAASESAIGLALLVLHYRHKAIISLDGISLLKN